LIIVGLLASDCPLESLSLKGSKDKGAALHDDLIDLL
jgi:hypothetical protein